MRFAFLLGAGLAVAAAMPASAQHRTPWGQDLGPRATGSVGQARPPGFRQPAQEAPSYQPPSYHSAPSYDPLNPSGATWSQTERAGRPYLRPLPHMPTGADAGWRP